MTLSGGSRFLWPDFLAGAIGILFLLAKEVQMSRILIDKTSWRPHFLLVFEFFHHFVFYIHHCSSARLFDLRIVSTLWENFISLGIKIFTLANVIASLIIIFFLNEFFWVKFWALKSDHYILILSIIINQVERFLLGGLFAKVHCFWINVSVVWFCGVWLLII